MTGPALQYFSKGSSSRLCALLHHRLVHGSGRRKSFPPYSFRL